MKEILISIDTSSAVSYVSVYKDEKVFTVFNESINSHSEEIDSLVRAACKKAEVEFKDISGIVLGSGPGSFTGLRIGAAYAKGLSFALKCPIFQYSSLRSAAYFLKDKAPIICVFSYAGRGEYFVSISAGNPEIMSTIDLLNMLKPSMPEVLLISNEKSLPEGFQGMQLMEFPPLSEALLRMHRKKAEADKKPYKLEEMADLEPLYVREVAARTLKDRGIET